MIIAGGATDVTTYFAMRLAADGTAATGLTATNFDLQYTRSGAAAAAKVDATLNGNGVGGAHSDSTVIEVDATSSPGLYRIDWVDAAFAAGVRETVLSVKVATAFTEHLRVEIDAEVNTVEWAGTDVVAGAIPAVAADGVGGLPISDAGGLDLDTILDAAITTRLAPTTAGRTLDITTTGEAGLDFDNTSGTLAAAQIASNAITADKIAADAITSSEIADGAITAAKITALAAAEWTALGDQYDGSTGLSGDTYPATQAQVSNIANVGAAANVPSSGFTLTTGSQVNAYTDTKALDGTNHELTDDAGTLDGLYKFSIGGDAAPVSVTLTGKFNGNNDSWTIQANAGSDGSPSWETIGTLSGSNSSSNVVHSFDMFTDQIVTDVAGEVQVRVNGTGLTSSSFDVDQVFVSKSDTSRSIGYAQGRIWLNTALSNTSVEVFVDGVADNPVSTIAAAKTLSTSLGLSDFHVINGSSFTLAEDSSNESYFGNNWTLALAGQTITGAYIDGASVSGVHVGAAIFANCDTGTLTTIADSQFKNCHLEGTITLPVGSVFFENCYHGGTPILDFGAVVGSTTVHVHKYAGGIEFQNFGDSGTDIVHLDGQGKLTINANSSGGTINLRGNWEIVNNASGVTINYDDQSIGYEGGAIWIDTTSGVAGTNPHINGTATNPVSTIADATTLSTALGMRVFHLVPGASVTLAQTYNNYEFTGVGYTVALGSQDIGGCRFVGGAYSGIGTGSSRVVFDNCIFTGATSLNAAVFLGCNISATITFTEATTYTWDRCFSGIAGTSAPTVDFGTAVGNVAFNVRHYSGGLQIESMGDTGTDTMSLEGNGQIIEGTCTGGTVVIRGNFTTSGISNLTLSDDARVDMPQINAEVVDAIATDTYAEPGQGAPAATASLAAKINYLFKSWRNKKDSDGTTTNLYADDGTTVDQKQTVSSVAGTVTKGEWESGP